MPVGRPHAGTSREDFSGACGDRSPCPFWTKEVMTAVLLWVSIFPMQRIALGSVRLIGLALSPTYRHRPIDHQFIYLSAHPDQSLTGSLAKSQGKTGTMRF